ncbi:MAG: hypothetical protein ACI9U2_002761 [Bradymonadia bacterium]|jgi:hypothetical protein
MRLSHRAAALGALTASLLAGSASAQDVDCADLENPIYMHAGSTVLPLLRTLGRALRDEADPITLVFVDGRSCAIIDGIVNATPLSVNLSYVPSTAEDAAWTPAMAPSSCAIPADGLPVDLAHADIFPESCGADLQLGDVAVFTGPVLPFVFVVPPASSQTAITAEEAYFVWGFGAAGQVAPWTEEQFLFTRPNTAGTKITFGANIRVPAARWKGEQLAKTGDVINAVASSVNAEATLGIVGGANYDGTRDVIKSLAYQAFDQQQAWYPDASAASFDKRNVRDGHYLLWGPSVFLTRVDDAGAPTNPRVDRVLRLLQSRDADPAPSFDSTGIIVDLGFIPDCAMGVARDGQAGDLRLYTPDAPCGCFFEARVGGDAGCMPCDSAGAGDCPGAQTCTLGFCEGEI